ncbi:MAG: hypothetical protein ACC653_09180 [Gammaproteobacteria bacterium]
MPGKPRFFSQIYKISTSIKILFLGLTSLLLISCGGGGGGSVPTPPAPPTNILATASYANTTCAIKAVSDAAKGTLTCWGQMPDMKVTGDSINKKAKRTFRTQATPQTMSPDATWTDVAIGRDHICGINSTKTGERLFCMGWNYNGQFGFPRIKIEGDKYNTENFHSTMIQISKITSWKKLSAAYDHTCGIYGNDQLKCWGANRFGVIAQNSVDPNDASIYIYSDLDTVKNVLESTSTEAVGAWLKVSTNDYHTCAIKSDNSLWCWGRNSYDQLGLVAGATPSSAPNDFKQFVTQVATPVNGFNPTSDSWIEVAAGFEHTCAISVTKNGANVPNKGKLWCWGGNYYDESAKKLGSTIILPDATTVDTNVNWIKVSSGRAQSCALNDLGNVYCWGFYAAVPFSPNTYSITAVAGRNENWSSVVTGYSHGCGVKTLVNSENKESKLLCWGQQQFSQLGTGFSYNSYIPNQILNDSEPLADPDVWKQIDTGAYHTCAIKNDNSLWCWGYNFNGRIGIGNRLPNSKLTLVSDTNDWQQVESYFRTTCARKTDSTLWCWGRNSNGQIGDDTILNSTTPIQTSGATVENDWSYLTVGKYFSCGQKTDKTLWCWGQNSYGQLGLSASLVAVKGKQKITRVWQSGKIFSGYHSICAIEDGTGDLYCWGRNDGQIIQNNTTASFNIPTKIPVPETGTKWIAAEVGRKYICALAGTSSNTTKGALWCWGENIQGTLGNKLHHENIGVGTPPGLNYIPVTAPFNVNTPGTAAGTSTMWKQVTAHDENVCAIKSDGTLWCWGYNYYGEHGTGNKVLSAAPVQEATKSNNWVMVKNGRNHTCGLQSQAGKTDYSLWCWGGRPFERQIGDLNLVDLQPKLVQ